MGWELGYFRLKNGYEKEVLILVLLEYGLGVRSTQDPIGGHWKVLILVLLEYGLGVEDKEVLKVHIVYSLNPCFVGIWVGRQESDS